MGENFQHLITVHNDFTHYTPLCLSQVLLCVPCQSDVLVYQACKSDIFPPPLFCVVRLIHSEKSFR